MFRVIYLLLLFIVCTIQLNAQENNIKKVVLQLQWKHQFQFAGYYVAKEKGYYKEYGIDVTINEFQSNTQPINSVIQQDVDFAVGRSSLILEADKNIYLLAAIFQSSPYILQALNDGSIKTLDDIVGKTIMMPDHDFALTASINAMLKAEHLTQNSFKLIRHSFNLDDLINKKTDFVSSYISNEPYLLKQKGYESVIFDPKDYGFDFYDDILFTRKSLFHNDPHLVHGFYKASMKGWEYAFKHIDETVDLILNKYNTQNKTKDHLLFEANSLKKLALPNGDFNQLGKIEPIRLREIDNTFRLLGLKRDYDYSLEDIIYDPNSFEDRNLFTNEELAYLANKKEIKMCVDPDWLPFEKIENGKHIGMSADYLKILEQKIGIPFKAVITQNWMQSIEYAKNRTCDIYSLAMSTPERLKYMDFTKPYLNIPLVIATRLDEPFVGDIKDILDKQLIGVQGYAILEVLRAKYPNINILEVENSTKALEAVRNKKAYGAIGSLSGLGYLIQKDFVGELKINGKFDQNWELGIGSRNDEPILNKILDKAINTMDPSVQRDIINKWISIKVEEKINIKTLLQFAVPILVLFIVFIIWIRKLSYEVNLRKKAEIQANEAYNEIQHLLDSTMEGILLLDKQGVCFKVNEQAVKIFGYANKDEMVGLKLKDLIFKDCMNTVKENCSKTITEPYQVMGLKSNKTQFPMLVKGQNYKGINNEYRVSTVLDMTELKDKEDMLIKQSKMVALGEMIGNIAHQWRQPLSVISLNASGIKFQKEFGNISDEEIMYLCNNINENAQYLSQTIDDFRDFIKDDKRKTLFNLYKNMERNISLIEGMLKKHEIKVEINIDEDCEVYGYDSELTQVVLNILNNAKDALEEHQVNPRYIFIEAQTNEDSLELRIKDNAGGIPEEYLKRIFEPYFTTKHQAQGTGIGLFMSYEIITKHMDGKIEARNVTYNIDGKEFTGAQFIITIPKVGQVYNEDD